MGFPMGFRGFPLDSFWVSFGFSWLLFCASWLPPKMAGRPRNPERRRCSTLFSQPLFYFLGGCDIISVVVHLPLLGFLFSLQFPRVFRTKGNAFPQFPTCPGTLTRQINLDQTDPTPLCWKEKIVERQKEKLRQKAEPSEASTSGMWSVPARICGLGPKKPREVK